MTFKKQFITIVLIVLLFAIFFSFLFYQLKKNSFIEHEINHLYEQRKQEFNSIIDTRKSLLIAIANSFTINNEVHRAYKNNDRDILIHNFESMWKTFQKNALVSEIHFFKTPAISFVNFSNIEKYNLDVKDIRQDIDWVSSSFTPSTHFLICRLFPGLRATYPIVIDNVLYGSISLGIDLQEINDFIKETHSETVSYFILNDAQLNKSLLPEKYKKLVDGKSAYDGYKVFDTTKNIDFLDVTKAYVFRDSILYSIFPIRDFNKRTIGYFIFEDNLKDFIDILFHYTLLYIAMFFFIGLASVYTLWRFLNTYNKDINHILHLLTALTNKNFSFILKDRTNVQSSYSEIQMIEEQIYRTSDDIQMYIELLSKEIQDYSDKALKDPLTNTFNRRALENIGTKILTKNKLSTKSTSLLIMDVDNFKTINDTHGHNIGDIVLKELSKNIKHIIRKDDLFVRYGGEEFIVLLPSTNISTTLEIAEKIRSSIEKSTIAVNTLEISFTISIGVSISVISDVSLEDLIKEADEKLYEAKKNGKNRVVV